MKIYIFGNNLHQLISNQKNFFNEWVLENPSEKDINEYELTYLFDYGKIKVYAWENTIFYVTDFIGNFLSEQTNNISASAYQVKDLSLEDIIDPRKIICNDDYMYNERLKLINNFGSKLSDFLEVFSLISNNIHQLSLMDEYNLRDNLKLLVDQKMDKKMLWLFLSKTFNRKCIKVFIEFLIKHGILGKILKVDNVSLKNLNLECLEYLVEKGSFNRYFTYLLVRINHETKKEIGKISNDLGFSKVILKDAKKLENNYKTVNESENIHTIEHFNKIISLKIDENPYLFIEIQNFAKAIYKNDLSEKSKKLQNKWSSFTNNELSFKSKKSLFELYLNS